MSKNDNERVRGQVSTLLTNPLWSRLVGWSVYQKMFKPSKRGFKATNERNILNQGYNDKLNSTFVHHQHKTSYFVKKGEKIKYIPSLEKDI